MPTTPDPCPSELPEAIAARILHQDAEVLILDKPSGLAVHPGPRGGPSLSDWLPALRQGRADLPQPAHRLDLNTAGCLALGRTKAMIVALNRLFAQGRIGKTYWALLGGPPPAETGLCEAPLLKRRTEDGGWRMSVDPMGQSARTEWRVLGRDGALTAVELTPHTGRTHQLRLHMAHLGCPILGDGFYGGGAARLHLLARTLALPLAPERRATAPVPEHMREALARCGLR